VNNNTKNINIINFSFCVQISLPEHWHHIRFLVLSFYGAGTTAEVSVIKPGRMTMNVQSGETKRV
jgi:hypothetical protein